DVRPMPAFMSTCPSVMGPVNVDPTLMTLHTKTATSRQRGHGKLYPLKSLSFLGCEFPDVRICVRVFAVKPVQKNARRIKFVYAGTAHCLSDGYHRGQRLARVSHAAYSEDLGRLQKVAIQVMCFSTPEMAGSSQWVISVDTVDEFSKGDRRCC